MDYDSARGVTVLFGGNSCNQNGASRLPAVSPPACQQHAMVHDSGRGLIVLFGGPDGTGGSCLSDTWEWNGATR